MEVVLGALGHEWRVRTKRLTKTLTRCRERLDGDERGEWLVQFVILFPLLIVMIGLVLDGGWMYWQYRRAEVTVNAAAQAASHAIDIGTFRQKNQVILDAGQATSIAATFVRLNAGGDLKSVSIFVAPRLITVGGVATIRTIFFQLFGIGSLTVRVQGQAYPAFGINVEGQ